MIRLNKNQVNRASQKASASWPFLANTSWGAHSYVALENDCSFRHYFRLSGAGGPSALLMHAPREKGEDTALFVDIARLFAQKGLTTPAIYAHDPENDFLLIEDFGPDSFASLLQESPPREEALYRLAIDALCSLHGQKTAEKLPLLEAKTLADKALLFIDWFCPAIGQANDGRAKIKAKRDEFREIWQQLFKSLPAFSPVIVHRDFHIDNLFLLPGKEKTENAIERCGIIDFQDASSGPPAYDVMSLLEDARRPLSAFVYEASLERYFKNLSMSEAERASFMRWFRALSAQRHSRVLGVFTRMAVQHKRPGYADFLPHTAFLLCQALENIDYPPLTDFLSEEGLVPNPQMVEKLVKTLKSQAR